MNNMQSILKAALQQAMDYDAYRQMTKSLLAEGKTTGPNQSEAMVEYTLLNDKRMDRLDKTVRLTPELSEAVEAIDRPLTWLVITEPWCGDASQIVPVIAKAGALNPLLTVSYLLRDEHPEVMDLFMTNSSRAIPKLAVLDLEADLVLGSWGARPAEAQKLVDEFKKQPESSREPYQEFVIKLQQWYNKDKTASTQQEIANFIHHVVRSA